MLPTIIRNLFFIILLFGSLLLFPVAIIAWLQPQRMLGVSCGVAGTVLLLLSFLYSLRKRDIIQFGTIPNFLRFHWICGWLGSLLIMVHSNLQIKLLLPWLATVFLLLAFIGGVVFAYILPLWLLIIASKKPVPSGQSRSANEINNGWQIGSHHLVKKLQAVQITLTITLSFLFIAHVLTMIIFGFP